MDFQSAGIGGRPSIELPRVSAPTTPLEGENPPAGNQSPVMKGDTAAAKMVAASVSPPTYGIFVGNVPLTPSTNSVDQITVAFHNSSRRTLSFIPPFLQNVEIVVRPSLDVIREGSRKWNCTVVGYFPSKRPYFHHLNDYVHSIWPADLIGFFFFQFKTLAGMEEVPVWIKMRHLPVELWTMEGLSIVASGIGKGLYQDAVTRACTRLDFALVCVMLDISSKLPKHVIIMILKEDGSETACKVDIKYEWLPPKCNTCVSLGHATKACPMTKPLKPAILIYVQKAKIVRLKPLEPEPVPRQLEIPILELEFRGSSSDRSKKGKDIIIYIAFDVLRLHDEDA
ncbi:UNVERIFIED_CONTAM: hypothetical protein Sradi_3617300 [Sesamum radiatum]|uniref:DUF4283 domain-containing protein n=1 Tax=Sesamum radiatum TaxID=300843 RepID=A0AAW2QH92_SESRA